MSDDPQLADACHVAAGSPCVGAGKAAYAHGRDIDGEAWAATPSIGCDEFNEGSATGNLEVSMSAAYSNVTVGFEVDFEVAVEGHALSNRWDFGDGGQLTNSLYASHGWGETGE